MSKILGSGFRGKDRSFTYGFTDEDGAFFVEYKKGKSFCKKDGEKLIKTLSMKLKHNLRDYDGEVDCSDKLKQECNRKILGWLDKIKEHKLFTI